MTLDCRVLIELAGWQPRRVTRRTIERARGSPSFALTYLL
jgi:hypothetical protein